MKIGLLHYTMPPVIGGVERVIAAHACLLRACGHDVVLYCDGRQLEKAAEFAFVAVPGFTNEGNLEENVAAFCRFMASEKLQILVVHNVMTMPFCPAATQACHELAAGGFPLVSWVHDLAACSPHYEVSQDSLLRKHPWGARIIAVSEERAAAYCKMTEFDAVTVIPNGIDVVHETAGTFCQSRPETILSLQGAFPILFLPARILKRKNIELGIRVVAELKRMSFQPRLLVSGAPEAFSENQHAYRGELNSLATALGVSEEILFLGDTKTVSDAEIGDLYHLSDALFFPSEQEGFGLPILEAAARRLPVFASHSQPLAYLAERHGFSFDLTLSPADLACRIVLFFEGDPASYSRKVVQRDFDWQAIYCRHMLPLLETFAS